MPCSRSRQSKVHDETSYYVSLTTYRFSTDQLLMWFQCNYKNTSWWLVNHASWYNLELISNLMHKILVYLHIIHLLNSSTCFEHYPAHLQEVCIVIVYMQPVVSSLSAGDCLVHWLRKKFLLNRCTRQSPAETDDTRGCTYTITSWTSWWWAGLMLETCRGA
jgi:hypothetical protein